MKYYKKILKKLDSEINYRFFRHYRYKRVVRRHLQKFYSDNAEPARNECKMIVYMADGAIYQGGIADRLRGMITLYDYCKEAGLDFRINFVYPFNLETYLLPARYDWRLKPGELSMNSRTSRPFYMDTRKEFGPREDRFQHDTFRSFFSKNFRQGHVYTIFHYAESRFAELFAELFTLSPELQKQLDRAKQPLGPDYISVSTRFLELLGDFEEPKPMVRPLPAAEQESLIVRCLDKICEIGREYCRNGEKILVTSDSSKFLDRASKLPGVIVIDGKVSHLSVNTDNRSDSDMKTFVDFFAIAGARHSFLLVSDKMYPGNFAKRASQITGHPYEEVHF